ncbi:MAG TPA: hypothetical protein VIV55_03670 [Flavobacterium sp.]
MIKNLPTYEEFEEVSKECFIQAFNLLFKVYEDYESYDDEVVREEVKIEELWKYNSGTLRTSTILLHQGIETFMKGTITRTSPLLLLEQKRSDWPTLPTSKDKDYDTLYTIAGENLLHTFCAVSDKITPTNELIDFIEKVRQKRNKAIHGASKVTDSAIALINDILQAYTYFFGINKWFEDLKKFNIENPLFGYFDWDFETILSYKYLDFLEATIGFKKIQAHISFDLCGRRYFCPTCKYEIEHKDGELKSKWAFLKPNTPESKEVYCVNCGHENEVIREKCSDENCLSNVLDTDLICMTCRI